MFKPSRWLVAPFAMAAGVLPLAFGVGAASATTLPAYGAQPCSETITIAPSTVAAGGSVTITLSGTCLSDVFTITLHSTPITLGTITTSTAGSGAGTFAIPSNLPPGAHSITAADSAGNTATSAGVPAAALTVTSPAGAPTATPGAVPAAATSSSSLPFTGADSVGVATAGAGALFVGGMLVLISRKRRRDNFT